MEILNKTKGLLIDLEGVLYVGDDLIPGAIETITKLSERFSIRYLTNTTTTSRNSIFKKLKKMNLPLREEHIFSPSIAITMYLKNHNINNIYLLTNPDLHPDFSEYNFDDKNPQAIILGDVYKNFNWDSLNKVFQLQLKNNSILIGLHKNKYCKRDNQISLDLGPFVSALEYATSKKAIIIGKPSKDFFDLAINSLNLNKNEIFMIGDDINADIGGAKGQNISAIQVKTGKYQQNDESDDFVQPDYRVDSIADLLLI